MTTPARRRLLRDFKKLQEDPPNTGTRSYPLLRPHLTCKPTPLLSIRRYSCSLRR